MEKELQENIVGSYRGLRRLLGKRFKDNFVLSTRTINYNNLEEALSDFTKYEEILLDRNDSNEYILKKVSATKYYLMSLLNYNISYEEYVKNTIGVNVQITSQNIIDDIVKEIKNKLEQLRIKYTKKEIYEKFYSFSMNKEQLKEYLTNEFKRQKAIVESYLELDFNDECVIEFVDEEIPYGYYLNIGEDNYILKVNLNMDKSRFNKASLRYAIAHEIFGHAMQLSYWKKCIREEKINEICGCEEDYGPEIIQLEGVGESIVYFVFKDEIDLEMEIELLLDKVHHLVQNNSYIMFNSGCHLEKCVDYYCDNYILSDREFVRKRILMSKDDSFYRANLYSYGSSLISFVNISEGLNLNKRKEFFRQMYLQPMTYDEILKYYQELKLGTTI
ncbi:MAG: hypothetical protein E6X34_06540 [Clostridium sp.]|uniref:hypothetical protein n=1 Tax=Clostridium sp. TaxID=1506 RepID=UPI00290AF24F|nr:hypothetical protein [Clostridium sp.]MDU4938095.1 hypothetical protein [Clostridium sp.]